MENQSAGSRNQQEDLSQRELYQAPVAAPNLEPVQPIEPPQDVLLEPPSDPPKKNNYIKYSLIVLGFVAALLLLIYGVRFFIDKEKKDEEVRLTYWGLTDETETIAPLIAKFESENPLVKISYIKQSSQHYRERLVNSLAKGAGPDIFRFHNTWVPMFSNHLSVVPLEVFDALTYQKTFYQVAMQDLQKDANLVGIPLQIDGLAMYVNEDIFNAENKLIPTTWDELSRVAMELTKKDAEGRIVVSGVAMGRTDNVDHWQDILSLLLLQNGADPTNPSSRLGQDAIEFFMKFSFKDNLWDEAMPASTQSFANGKLAIYFGPSRRVRDFKLANPSLRFKVVPVPQLPKLDLNQPNVNFANYWAEGVWNKSKGQEAAWKFLKYLSTQEVLEARYQAMARAGQSIEPFSRQDMAAVLLEDPHYGAYIRQANSYKSWYMASSTFDGQSGLNSKLSAVYAKTVAVFLENNYSDESLGTVATEITKILEGYGLN